MFLSRKQIFIIIVVIAVVLLVFGSFIAGFYFGKKSIPSILQISAPLENKETNKPAKIDFGLFWDVWKKIEEKFLKRNELNYQEMVYGAISGMVKGLNDPYSEFMPPKESKQFIDDIKGKFEGIGAEIGIRKGVLTVISPLKNSPAEKAGLKAGDKIIKIDDRSTADITLNQAVSLIRGPKGTVVTLTILRDSLDKSIEIKITRAVIKIPVLEWKIINNNIAYIQIFNFSESLIGEFNKTVQKIIKSNANKIILDLRNNPGGYLEVAQEIASWFLKRGEVITQEDFGDKKDFYRSFGYEILGKFPIVILVNEGSASASEILAGALRDLKNVPLVGTKTFGKGSVQILENFKDGSSLKITIAKWLTPNGVSISDEGLKPDYEIKLTDEDIENNRDPQLDKAIEIINKMP